MDEPIPVDQAARAEQQRLQSEAEAAAQAQVLFRTGSAIAPASGPLPVGGDLAAARFPAVPPASSVQNDDYAQQNRQADKRAFVAAAPDSRPYGSAALQMPRSPSQLLACPGIPAPPLPRENSDLPGQVSTEERLGGK